MKLARLLVQADFYLALLKQQALPLVQIVQNPLPRDAEVARVGWDDSGQLHLILYSQTFQDVAFGEPVPQVPLPIVRTARPGDDQPACINCQTPFRGRDALHFSYGVPDFDYVGPFCAECDHAIKVHTGFKEKEH